MNTRRITQARSGAELRKRQRTQNDEEQPFSSSSSAKQSIIKKRIGKKGIEKIREQNHVYTSPSEAEKKYPDLKPYKNKENLESLDAEYTGAYEDQDDSDGIIESEYEEEDSPYGNNMDVMEGSSQIRQNTQFSVSSYLRRSHPKSSIDKVKDAVKHGNLLEIGSSIRHGFYNDSLTELQLEEVARTAQKPTISLLQFHQQLEEATQSEKDNLMMGQLFLTKMAMTESKTIDKLKASVTSLASSFTEQTKISVLQKRGLDTNHVIEPTEEFPRIDLVYLYNKSSLIGDSAFSQMTFFLTRAFKNALLPAYKIWYFTYRPKCVRPTDKHFLLFPEEVAEKLIDFAYDAVGVYLPDRLLNGEIDVEDEFLKQLKVSDVHKEVERRRKDREVVADTMKSSIGQMLNYLRDYHFSVESGELDNCKLRSSCSNHLTWRDVKLYRDYCRANSIDADSFDPKNIIGFGAKNTFNGQPKQTKSKIKPKS